MTKTYFQIQDRDSPHPSRIPRFNRRCRARSVSVGIFLTVSLERTENRQPVLRVNISLLVSIYEKRLMYIGRESLALSSTDRTEILHVYTTL